MKSLNEKDCFKAIINNNWDRVDQDIEDVMRSALARDVDIIELDSTASILSSVVQESILSIIDDFQGVNKEIENN